MLLLAAAILTNKAIAFLVTVWGIILAGTGWCFYRLLTSKKQFGDNSED